MAKDAPQAHLLPMNKEPAVDGRFVRDVVSRDKYIVTDTSLYPLEEGRSKIAFEDFDGAFIPAQVSKAVDKKTLALGGAIGGLSLWRIARAIKSYKEYKRLLREDKDDSARKHQLVSTILNGGGGVIGLLLCVGIISKGFFSGVTDVKRHAASIP